MLPVDLSQSRETDPGYVLPKPNLGAPHAFEQGLKEGFGTSMSSLGVRAFKYWRLRQLVNGPDDPDLIDKKTFDQQYSLDGLLKFDPHAHGKMSRFYAEELMNDTLDDKFSEFQGRLSYAPVSSFVGNMLGGMASPADLLMNYVIPNAALAKWGMTGTALERGGTGAARLAARTVNGAINGAIGGTASVLPMEALYEANQKEFTLQDALGTVALGPVMGAAAGMLHGAALHAFGDWDRHFANAVNHAAMTDKDPNLAAKIAGSDPRFAKLKELRDKVKAALAKGERTPEDDDLLSMVSGEPVPDMPTDRDIVAADEARSGLPEGRYFQPEDTTPPPRSSDSTVKDEPLKARNKRLIDEALKDGKKITEAQTDDERFLADAWKTLWGVELKFVSPDLQRTLGMAGWIRSSEPTKAYVGRGPLNDGSIRSMMFLAGHELGHAVRLRDPELWQGMVKSIMATASSDEGALARAWKENSKAKQGSGVWAGLDLYGKMDEAFASVLGQAMQHRRFWQTLYQQTPNSANRLARLLFTTRARLESVLSRGRRTKETMALYDGLSTALANSGFDQTTLAVDRSLESLYLPHREQMQEFTARMSERMNEIGTDRELELARFLDMQREMFPEVGSLSDQSGGTRFTTILRDVHIDSDNPGLWLLTTVFKKSKPGTPERKFAQLYADRLLKWDGVSRTPSGDKDYAKSAFTKYTSLKDPKAPKYPSLVTFKRNANGTWDLGIHRNDDFPRWHEIITDEPSSVEAVTRAFVQEELDAVREAFQNFTKGNVEGGTALSSSLLDEYMTRLSWQDFDALVSGEDPRAFWSGFNEFLEEKMDDYRLGNDRKAYENLDKLHQEVDPLSGPNKEGYGDKTGPGELMVAWERFRQRYKDIADKLDERNLAKHPNMRIDETFGGTTKEAFQELFDRTYMDIKVMLSEQLAIFDALREMSKNEANANAGLKIDERTFFARDIKKLDARMEKALREMAHRRIIESGMWPQYERVMKIDGAVKAAEADIIRLSSLKPDDLPENYRDANEQFDVSHDQGDELYPMASTPEEVKAEVGRRRFSAEEAKKIARARLDLEHTNWSKFLTSYESSASAHITERLAGTDAEGWSIDYEPPQASPDGTTKDQGPKGPLFDELERVREKFNQRVTSINKLLKNGVLDESFADNVAIMDRFAYHERNGNGPMDAAKLTLQDLRSETLAKAIQVIGYENSKKNLLGRARQGLDTLYSYLDGNSRKNVKAAGASVAESMGGRIVADASPFTSDLISLGLDRAWSSNDEVLLRGLIREMKGLGNGDPVLKQLAETLRKTHEVQTGRLNSLGAHIRLLDGYVFSQVHNAYAIKGDKEAFIGSLLQWIDWDRTEKAVGNNRYDKKTGKNFFDPKTYLEQLHHELSQTERPVPVSFNELGGNIANQVSHRRTIYFKDTYAFDYDMRYGSGNTAGLITEQIVKRAEQATIMEHFGADYKRTWAYVMGDLSKAGDWRTGKLGRINLTFQQLTGDLNHPDNVKTAAIGQAVRQYMNSVTLWMSSISSLTDIGNATSTLRWMGLDSKDLTSRLAKGMKAVALEGPQGREFLISQGAGLQALLAGFARTEAMHGPAYRWAQKASDFTFKWNGQEMWTRSLQYAFHDIASQHLGDMAGASTLSPDFTNWLSHFDISVDEWGRMAKYAADVEGLKGTRLAPDMIPDEALAQKLRVALGDSMHQAALEPSVSDKAITNLWTKAGTPLGEAVRTMMQYKGYPLAMVRRITRRFDNAYGNQKMSAFGIEMGVGNVERLAWATSMISLAATALMIKDVLRGREPFNPFDTEQWTIGNASRIVAQAGVGPFAALEQFLSPHQLAGPAFGAAGSLALAAASGNGYRTTNAVMGILPGSSIAPLKESAKAILGVAFADSYGVHYQNFLRRQEQETGQSSIFLDN